MEKLERNKGITMISLIVTIIVLLILAGISIGMLTGDNGLINKAKEAKEATEITEEKETLEYSIIQAMGKSKYGNIKKENLENTLRENIGENKTNVIENAEEIVVKFIESNRCYEIDADGNISEPIIIGGEKYAGDISKGGTLDGSKDRPSK